MKIAIINDTHFGARGDSTIFLQFFEEFFKKCFFPFLKENNINEILHLGDLVDKRKNININTLSVMKKSFINECNNNEIKLNILIGNHDSFYKNTNQLNAITEILDNDNINIVYNNPKELQFGSTKILLVPWINKENYDISLKMILQSKAPVLMGHLEINGFEMLRGITCSAGLSASIFNSFQNVYSGHFHHPSEIGNIQYLGAPYQMTWSDYGEKRGFHVFDTETRNMEFVENPYTIFEMFDYDDSTMTIEDIKDMDVSVLRNKYVMVKVKSNKNPVMFDLFSEKLMESGAADVKIIESSIDLELSDEDAIIDNVQDTPSLINQFIDNVDLDVDKKELKMLFMKLHAKAIQI